MIKTRMFFIFLACWFAILSTAYAQSQATPAFSNQPSAPTPFAQAVIDNEKAFIDAIRKGDVQHVKNAIADDFAAIAPNGDMADKEEMLHYVYSAGHESGPEPILYGFRIVPLDDASAVVTYNAVFPHAGIERYQHLSHTWVKHGEQWKLKFQQTTLNLWSAHDL